MFRIDEGSILDNTKIGLGRCLPRNHLSTGSGKCPEGLAGFAL
jgi:hypothetical protein